MIPLFWPSYDGKQIQEAMKKLFPINMSNRWIGQGPLVDKFENEFSKKFNFKYCIMINSGTAALHIAYVLAGLKEGDEIIVPVLNCTADLHPLKWMKVEIKFADINPETLNIDPKSIEKKITKKTKAILALHFGGLVCEINKIKQIAREHNLKIIEDACQALGAKNIGQGDYTAMSFQAIKNFPIGNGGMLIVKNRKDYKRAKMLRWFSIDREQKILKRWQAWDKRGITFDQKEPGFKYQPTDIDAAIGLAQLKYFDNFLEGKLLDADISCHVLAVYNNVKASDPNSESFKTGFPETEETYIERCRSSYLKVSQEENTLIAEPELKEIREKITKYIQEVKTIALFALDGGHDVSVINEYEKNIDQLRLETREAILKAKRQYNISF